jgi:hypothetical protein
MTDVPAYSSLKADLDAALTAALGTDGTTVSDGAAKVLGAIGANNANNAFSSSSVVANVDGSVLERLEYQDVHKFDCAWQCTSTGAAILANGTTVFTVAGGPIRITDLVSYCVVDSDSAAATLQWSADGTVGAATTFTGATTSTASLIAGTIIYNTFTALTTAPVITQTAGVALAGVTTSTGGGIYVPAGIITMVIGGADTTTTTWAHYMRWYPLASGVTVTAAF